MGSALDMLVRQAPHEQRRALKYLDAHVRERTLWCNQTNLPQSIKPLEFELLDFFDSISFLKQKKLRQEILAATLVFLRIHEGQRRRDKNEPYFAHVLRVAQRAADFLGLVRQLDKSVQDEKIKDAIIAALAHDSIEDHAEKLAERAYFWQDANSTRVQALSVVEKMFNIRVRHWVSMLSAPPYEKKQNKQAEYAKWVRAIWQDRDFVTTILKLSDILDNLSSSLDFLEKDERNYNANYFARKGKAHKQVLKYTMVLMSLHKNYDKWACGILKQKAIKNEILRQIERELRRSQKFVRGISI